MEAIAIRPISRRGCRIVVSGGSLKAAISMSSNPITDKTPGTSIPCACTARITPIAVASSYATIAVGASSGGEARRSCVAWNPPSGLRGEDTIAPGRQSRLEKRTAEPEDPKKRWPDRLGADEGDPLMPERDQMANDLLSRAIVVEHDLREGRFGLRRRPDGLEDPLR